MPKHKAVSASAGLLLVLAACSEAAGEPDEQPTANTAQVAAIPDSLAPFGDGYPNAGDACRRLGESPATLQYLDDSATLVGCPDASSAAALGGTVVGLVDGVSLVSIAQTNADARMAQDQGSSDALVPGTDYNATASIKCGFNDAAPDQSCDAGVKRGWGDDGTTLVEVAKPDGRKRAIFFQGLEAYGADSAQSDGSAGWDFETSRDGDMVTINYGPETYVIPDALVEGG